MSFNPDEFGLPVEEYEAEDDGESGPLLLAEAPPPRVDQGMLQAEKRLAKASCYKVLIHGTFFDRQDAVTAEVEREIKEFVRSRFEDLLGMMKPVEPPKPPPSIFNDIEVKVLKDIASQVLRRQQAGPAVFQAPQPQQPTLAAPKAQEAAYTQPAPAQSPVGPPKLKKRKAPAEAAPPQQAPVQPKQVKPKMAQRKKIAHVRGDGTKIEMDVTRQVQPSQDYSGAIRHPNLGARQQEFAMQTVSIAQVSNPKIINVD